VEEHGFRRLRLARTVQTPAVEKSESDTRVPHDDVDEKNELHFNTAEELLDFVTLNWLEKWVTTDVWDETVLDVLSRRPSFLLISVDAPVSMRWERFKAR
jgi:dCMP deaminase